MTWKLKSGRVLFFEVGTDTALVPYPHEKLVWACVDILEPMTEKNAPAFTPAERREIADAVKAAWDAWAERGEAK
jgi:hypothetical protein